LAVRPVGGPLSTLAAYASRTRDALLSPPVCRIKGEPFATTKAAAEAIQLSLKNALVFDVGRSYAAARRISAASLAWTNPGLNRFHAASPSALLSWRFAISSG
jgi:hypothetical protein